MRFYIPLLSIMLLPLIGFSQDNSNPLKTTDSIYQKLWVEAKYDTMTLQEKVGQLFMVRAFSNQGNEHVESIKKLIKENHIGGLIFSKGGPVRQAKLNNQFQALSKMPLLIGMDAEWGLSMRLDSTYAFPWNMTLGAIRDNSLIERTGKHIGEHCKRLGVHFNFAPVADINTNPRNPIIGNRSFGEDRNNVTEKSLAFMNGMQKAGVLANAKHFPGHGDTDSDSHKTLPTINFSRKRIDSIELYPYKKLIDHGLSSVMVAHLNVPNLESKAGIPSSLSKNIVTNILKDSLQFKGLIFTDALEMKGVSNHDDSADVDLAAFMAGNDVLLISEDPAKGISKIMEAYEKEVITEQRLSHSVKKILMAKYKVGLQNYRPVEIGNLYNDLNRKKDDLLYEELMENAITVVENKNELLPLRNLDTKTIAYVSMGDDDGSVFYNELKKYGKVHSIKAKRLDEMLKKLKSYNTVIIGLHRSNDNPWKSFEFTTKELVWLYEIARNNTVVLDIFVRPYALLDIKTFKNFEGVVVSYQNSKISQQKSAQLIFGAIPSKGTFPVTTGANLSVGVGLNINSVKTLRYGRPERVGMSSELLERVDSLAQNAVDSLMTPGIQLLIARKGMVVYNKNFGKHTYEGDQDVRFDDIYDVASLTKILATIPLIMELEEQGIMALDSQLGQLMPSLRRSNKSKMTIKQILSHYARLRPWIPFYLTTVDSNTKMPLAKYYRRQRSKEFNIEVTNELYMRSDYMDSINKIVKDTELLDNLEYRYSDLPYYLMKQYIEEHYGKPMDELVQQHFYKPLGANYTTYNPSGKFSDTHIIPTEEDTYYRHKKVQGYVHDMGAAMQNGVGGHAGVFSNANDVAKIMQMYLQKGFYGGKRYFRSETLGKFNKCYYCNQNNRRGVGFDKPQLGDEGPTCGCVSTMSFGHSGFTGTYAWADPEEEIVYVFLANRTYPDAANNRLLNEGVRTEIQRLIYEAIIE